MGRGSALWWPGLQARLQVFFFCHRIKLLRKSQVRAFDVPIDRKYIQIQCTCLSHLKRTIKRVDVYVNRLQHWQQTLLAEEASEYAHFSSSVYVLLSFLYCPTCLFSECLISAKYKSLKTTRQVLKKKKSALLVYHFPLQLILNWMVIV